MSKEDCKFCKLINRESPISIVYEDEKVISFMDIQPINPGHLLIIPKTHASYLKELEPDTGCHMFKTAMRLSRALRMSGIRCEGVNFFLADGEVAGQHGIEFGCRDRIDSAGERGERQLQSRCHRLRVA